MSEIKWSILMVEDDKAIVGLMQRAFGSIASPSFSVTHAGSLKAATDLLRDRQVDVVLLDLGLPDSRGMGTLERLVKAAPGVPVVIITGGADVDPVKAAEMGAEDFLQKGDVDFKRIFKTVLFAIQRRRRAAPGGDDGAREEMKTCVDLVGTAVSLFEKGMLSAEDALKAVKNAQQRLKGLV
jgi:DNA-binding NtrC family response regulator